MIGDNPIVVTVVLLGIAAYLYMRLSRQSDRRRCPACRTVALALVEPGTPFECRHCGTRLVAGTDGAIRRAPA